MPRLRLIALILALAVLATLAGCANHRRSDNLTETLNAYASTIRWNSFKQGLGFVSPDYRKEHPLTQLQIRRYQQVRVAGYDEGSGAVPVSEGKIRQVVRISLINRNTQRERDVIDHQTWEWDEKASRWWLTSGLPKIAHEPPPGF